MRIISARPLGRENLPASELADFLRLRQDPEGKTAPEEFLYTALQTAIDEIEARVSFVIFGRNVKLTHESGLPAAIPFSVRDEPSLRSVRRGDEAIDTSEFQLIIGKEIRIDSQLHKYANNLTFYFSLGPGRWESVEGDLQMAVLVLAAQYYRNRDEGSAHNFGIPAEVRHLIEKHRIIRLG